MAVGVVLALACAGLALAVLLLRGEPSPATRLAAQAACALGFILALLAALATGKSAWESAAVAFLGAAVLPLVLLGQMRLVRALTTRR